MTCLYSDCNMYFDMARCKHYSCLYGHSEYLLASHEVLSQFTEWPRSSRRRWFFCIWSPLGIDGGLYFGGPYQVPWQSILLRLTCHYKVPLTHSQQYWYFYWVKSIFRSQSILGYYLLVSNVSNSYIWTGHTLHEITLNMSLLIKELTFL